jgi:hypothetical protein
MDRIDSDQAPTARLLMALRRKASEVPFAPFWCSAYDSIRARFSSSRAMMSFCTSVAPS